jgi:dihydropyrimidine dehydrogenase (NAD+) subunit PreA
MPSMPDGVGEQLSSFRTPAQLDRDTIIYPKFNPEKCVGCHLCRIVCPTGAIGVTKRTVKRK